MLLDEEVSTISCFKVMCEEEGLLFFILANPVPLELLLLLLSTIISSNKGCWKSIDPKASPDPLDNGWASRSLLLLTQLIITSSVFVHHKEMLG